MRGPAGKGSSTRGETELGEYDPHKSSINFAVPHSFPEMIDHYIQTDPLPIYRSHHLSLDLNKFKSNKQDERN